MIIDSEHTILSVIDWEDAFMVPWEIVEFCKTLSIVLPAINGPIYHENEDDLRRQAGRTGYLRVAREAELARGFPSRLSTVLGDEKLQNFAHAMWLHDINSRIEFIVRFWMNW